jgi:hypothetical protein
LLAFLAQWAFRLAKFSTKWFYLATLKKRDVAKKKRWFYLASPSVSE